MPKLFVFYQRPLQKTTVFYTLVWNAQIIRILLKILQVTTVFLYFDFEMLKLFVFYQRLLQVTAVFLYFDLKCPNYSSFIKDDFKKNYLCSLLVMV